MAILDRHGKPFPEVSSKEFTGDAFKKGLDFMRFNSDKGVSQPMKDSSVVFTCISKISSSLPQAVLKFYRGEDDIESTNPIVSLFDRPNPSTNQAMFFEHSTMFFSLYGEVFWYIVKSAGQVTGSRNLPAEFSVLDPRLMKEVIKSSKLVGWLYNNKVALDLDEVLHIKFPNPYSALRGLSPIDSIRADMDQDYLAGRYGKQFFVNGAAPSTVFTTHEEDESTDEQRKVLLKQWNALHQGVSNSHKAAILNAGMDIKTVGLTQEQMAYVESRKYSAQRIMGAFGVPPAVGGDWDAANYSNAVVAKQIFWHETLMNYIRRYENMINSFIVYPYDKSIRCKFDLSEVSELQKDGKEVADLIKSYASIGVPVNVLLEKYRLPFGNIEGLDVGYINMSNIPVGSDPYAENTSAPAKEVQIDEEYTKILDDSIEKGYENNFIRLRTKHERVFNKELGKYWFKQRSKIVSRLLGKKSDNMLSVSVLLEMIDIWKQENINLEKRFNGFYENLIKDAGISALTNIGQDTQGFQIDPNIITKRINILKGINNTTSNMVKNIITAGVEKGVSVNEIADNIKKMYSTITKTRAMNIARTETGSAINAQQTETYKSKGVKKKKWGGGTRDSHSAVSGTIVGINEKFSVGSDSLEFPGDPSGSAKECCNCTCYISPHID